MRIAINGFFWDRPHVGSGQYLHQLVARLPHCLDVERVVVLRPALGAAGPPPPEGVEVVPLATPFDRQAQSGRRARLARNLAKLWFEQVSVPLLAEGTRADLLHVAYFAPPLRCRLPVTTTIHDLVPLLLPEYRGSSLVRAYMRLVSAAARKANAILTDSEQSRRDVITHLQINPQLVTTVYLAAAEIYNRPPAPDTVAASLARLKIRQPFVYYVGGFDARKNLQLLLRAWALVAPRRSDATLVLAGRLPNPDGLLFPDLRGQIAALGLQQSVQLPGFVSDADNQALYAGSAAFVFPSRYEGFGLPPLEALASGALVLCANSSSLPEIVGDAARLLSPDDPASWAEALSQALDDPAQRERARHTGPTRAAQFSARRMADETVAVYRRALISSGDRL